MINAPKQAMACGHVSNGNSEDEHGNKIPVCISCYASPLTRNKARTAVDLKGRMAICSASCGVTKPSSPELSYFQYTGEEFDKFYNGCQGW